MNLDEARALHDQVAVVDLHADTPKLMHWLGLDLADAHERPMPGPLNYVGHVDIPRMRAGGVSAQVFGMWTWPYPQRGCAASVHAQLDALDTALRKNADDLAFAPALEDVAAARARGAIAVVPAIEGGQALEGDLDNVSRFAARGVRSIGLLHFSRNQLGAPAYGTGSDNQQGLTDFGREVVREMNRLGMIVDLAHINRKGFFEAIEHTQAPVMVTHTGVLGVHRSWRNIDDAQLRAVADTGGCVGVIFAKRFLGGNDIEFVVDHLVHIIDVAGEDVAALGSDFDGLVVPARGLDDVADMPKLTAALARRGLSEAVLSKVLGGNALRVFGDVPPRGLPAGAASVSASASASASADD
ncbi:dipeptidase [Haliangium ochraceum]|uniref:Membrane dipeptidase n=1 Tax=Haliangium ochraceum (strain DSM 14365 / JCM 11303 / SMP-2) TaxID=502025 RepID=D0LSQ3_HALO1|nr:dipeptidase [Haliangium ochraceum]ACY17275.1 Membrane dipeptidase [Haliangium ochraceum DSM 14365]